MLLVAYGTRPEYIKLAPVIRLLAGRVAHRVVFTGQHLALEDTPYDVRLTVPAGDRLDAIIRGAMDAPASVFEGIRAVLVQGDTASAFGIALAAFHRGLPVVHLEAGLRTYDLAQPFPEELYRQMISRIATLHLCPTALNRAQLESERCAGRIEVVGNSVLDDLLDLPTSTAGPVLMSLHRRENQPRMAEWSTAFEQIAVQHPLRRFVFVRHPNPASAVLHQLMRRVEVIDPLPVHEMRRLLASTPLLITDSGGFQEEGSFLGKRMIVCRRATERPEIVGTHSVLCPEPSALSDVFDHTIALPPVTDPCPYGDGRTAPRVVSLIEELLGV